MLTSMVLHAAELGRELLPGLIDYAVRGTVVLALAGIVTLSLRRAPAALRHGVWVAAVCIIAVLPLLVRTVPSITVPLPRVHDAAPRAMKTTANFVFVQVPEGAALPAKRTITATSLAPAPASARKVAAVIAPPARSLVSFAPLWLVGWWMLGVLVMLDRLLIGKLTVWRRGLRATPLRDPVWRALVGEMSRELGITRPIALFVSHECAVPVTWGIVRPVLLLPTEAETWPAPRRRAVALHELAHVARFDAGTQLVAQLVLAFNWFNPLAWLAVARMRVERERACDEVVLDHGTRASEYAGELLAIARMLGPRPEPALASLAMARCSELEGRIRAILDLPGRQRALSRRDTLFSFGAALPVLVLVAAVHPRSESGGVPIVSRIEFKTRVAVPKVPLRGPTFALSAPVIVMPSPVATVIAAPAPMSTTVMPDPSVISSAPAQPSASASTITPSPSVAYGTRCPVHTDFVQGGVSAERGDVGALEAEKDDHVVMVLASDGRCVTLRLDGLITVSPDGGHVASIGRDASISMVDRDGGPTRNAEIRTGSDGVTTGAVLRPGDVVRVKIYREPDLSGDYQVNEAGIATFPRIGPVKATDITTDSLQHLLVAKYSQVLIDPAIEVTPFRRAAGDPTMTAGTEVQIRGVDGAVTRGQGPLYIIDGVIVGDPLNPPPEPIASSRDSDADKKKLWIIPQHSLQGAPITRTYFVDNKQTPWTEGESWFATTLAEVVRETAYDAARRIPNIRRTGGVTAVLDEIRHTRNESARRQYFQALLDSGPLRGDEVRQTADLAQSSLASSPDKERILAQLRG